MYTSWVKQTKITDYFCDSCSSYLMRISTGMPLTIGLFFFSKIRLHKILTNTSLCGILKKKSQKERKCRWRGERWPTRSLDHNKSLMLLIKTQYEVHNITSVFKYWSINLKQSVDMKLCTVKAAIKGLQSWLKHTKEDDEFAVPSCEVLVRKTKTSKVFMPVSHSHVVVFCTRTKIKTSCVLSCCFCLASERCSIFLSLQLSFPWRYFQQVPEKENPVTVADPVVSCFSSFAIWTAASKARLSSHQTSTLTHLVIHLSGCGAMCVILKYVLCFC